MTTSMCVNGLVLIVGVIFAIYVAKEQRHEYPILCSVGVFAVWCLLQTAVNKVIF